MGAIRLTKKDLERDNEVLVERVKYWKKKTNRLAEAYTELANERTITKSWAIGLTLLWVGLAAGTTLLALAVI